MPLYSYWLCHPTTTNLCEPSRRERCKYEYKTHHEEKEVCKEMAKKVCDKVWLVILSGYFIF